MEVVVVEHAVGQPVKVVQRAKGLRQFLMQAIAHFLWAGIGGNENGGGIAPGDKCPIDRIGAAFLAVVRQRAYVGDDKAGGRWGKVAQFGAAGEFDGNPPCAGSGMNVDPGFGLQPRNHLGKILGGRSGHIACKSHRDRPLKAREG